MPSTCAPPLLPVALRHPPAVGPEPPDVGQPGALALARRAGSGARRKTGCVAAQRDQPLRERRAARAALVVELPVEPGDLVVLAPGVVVAALRAAELVAAEQHRHALREEQRGQEVALLARAQRVDLRVVGLALDAAVPGAVVVGAVAVVLAGWPRCASRCRRRGRAA